MQNNKLKIYKTISLILGGICSLCAVWLVVLLAVAGWQFFAITPVWLGFLLLLILGLGLMLLCVFLYLLLCIKSAVAETVVCESCGAECHYTAAFCASCGAKLEKDE